MRRIFTCIAAIALAGGCQTANVESGTSGVAAEADWASHGRGPDEQRFSPLDAINDGNVAGLKLAWSYDLDTARGQEATPIVVGGRMFVSTAWSKVKAFDAATGRLLWAYDPQVPGAWAVNGCCDVVNRGVAYAKGRVFVGTFDGRLVALDATSGRQLWDVNTIDRSKPYTITGAPRVVKGKVLIGNGGAEFGVRGYVSAYDEATGKLVWRFYTVPGDPAKPDGAASDAVLRDKALPTWTGEWWKLGGGGTVWDAMAYDPDLDLLYIGTGNGAPWNQKFRSPGGGDNLFLASVVALRPDTGAYVWHYQETPGDAWDYTSTQQMILADLEIGGRLRKVLLHAPKNGFFYVLDRETGALISAEPFIPGINWATRIDQTTGRPVETPEARYYKTGKMFVGMPGAMGAHSWHPMAFSPRTGLVYIPAQEVALPFAPLAADSYSDKPMQTNEAVDWNALSGPTPTPAQRAEAAKGLKGRLLAWDPVRQKAAWSVEYRGPANGGTLATAGNLVFQGTAAGEFVAYSADQGKRLWTFDAQGPIIAGPVSFSVGARQYIAVLSGWGGNYPLVMGYQAGISGRPLNVSRVLVFSLNGKATLPPPPPEAPAEIPLTQTTPPPPAAVLRGRTLYDTYCSRCHGGAAVGGGVIPDLRHSAAIEGEAFGQILLEGLLEPLGMVSFRPVLSEADVEAIRAYLVARKQETLAEQRAARR